MLLIAMPFIDVRAERRPLRRPVALVAVVLVVLSMGDPHLQGRDREGGARLGARRRTCRRGRRRRASRATQQAIAGAKLFAVVGCLNCHTYNGDGSHNLGAPDLTAEGAKNKGIAFQIAHLKCPACVNPGCPMPSFAGLGEHDSRSSRRSSRPRRAASNSAGDA